MTDPQRTRQNQDSKSVISRCNSISSEAYVSLRARRNCPPGKTPRKIDVFAQDLKDYYKQESLKCATGEFSQQKRLNSCFHQYRFVIAMMAGLSVGLMLFHRYGMTISILRMVNQTHLYLEEHPNNTMQDFLDEGYIPGGEFIWNNEIVAIILGWYMFSYTLPQTLAAKWTVALGCRWAVPISLIICTVSNMLVPSAAYLGWKWVLACRLINGVGAAGIYPGMLNLLEDWMRYDELSSGLSTAQFLIAFMSIICPLVSGYLTAIHWSLAFYVPSYVTLAFCVIWVVLVTNKPQSNRFISEKELNHLNECDMVDTNLEPTKSLDANRDKPAPQELENGEFDCNHQNTIEADLDFDYKPDSWTQILKLRQFYAYLVIWMLNCSSYTVFVFVLPIYMRQFLKIRISENGFYCSIIQLGFLIACVWPHQVLRLLVAKNVSTTRARNLSQGFSSLIMAITFIYVGTYHQYQLPLLFLNRCFVVNDVIITASVLSNFAKAGMSSVAFAMINTIGNLSITGSSTFFGWLLDYTGSSRAGWQIIFCCLGVAQLAMFLTFAIFIDSNPIKFHNKPKEMDQSQMDKSDGLARPVFTIGTLRRDSLISSKQSQWHGLDNYKDSKVGHDEVQSANRSVSTKFNLNQESGPQLEVWN